MGSKFDDVVPHVESRVSFKSPLKANTVEIHIKREKEESKIGSSSKVLLNDLVSFEADYIRGVLNSTLQDDDRRLCNCLSYEIAEEAEGAGGGPLYIIVGVRLVPRIFLSVEEKDTEPCAICSEDITHSAHGPHSSTMSCDHEFHDDCLYDLFIESSTPACPVCGTVFDDDKL